MSCYVVGSDVVVLLFKAGLNCKTGACADVFISVSNGIKAKYQTACRFHSTHQKQTTVGLARTNRSSFHIMSNDKSGTSHIRLIGTWPGRVNQYKP